MIGSELTIYVEVHLSSRIFPRKNDSYLRTTESLGGDMTLPTDLGMPLL